MSRRISSIVGPAVGRLRGQMSKHKADRQSSTPRPSPPAPGTVDPEHPAQRITDVVNAVNELTKSQFPDLSFRDPGSVLDLSETVDSVTALRIDAPGKDFLRLASVLITADRLTDPVAETTRRMSSVLSSGYEKKLKQGLLFDAENRSTSVHSKEEYGPWLEIDFEHPVDLRHVTVRNRPDRTAPSRPDLAARVAAGIQVRCRTSEGRWELLYDGVERERELVHACSKIYGPVLDAGVVGTEDETRSMSSVNVGADLVEILSTLQLRDYQLTLARDLDRVDLSADGKREFRDAVNSQILHQRQLEWIIHGVRRSFRFWSEDEKRQYVDHATQVVDDLTELSPSVCFGFGSVLAVVRDGELIPHDDDLDVIIGFEPEQASTVTEAFKQIEDFLIRKGYTVAGDHHAHRRVSQRGVKKIDVFAGIFEGDRIGWYPGHRNALHRDTLFPGRSVPFLGRDCLVPRNPEQYLEEIYGPDWQTPDQHFSHGTAARQEYANTGR